MDTALFLPHDVAELADAGEYVDAVREGYRQRGEGAPTEPRTMLVSEDLGGSMTAYVAMLPDTGAMGGYVYDAGFGDADARFVSPLFDAESGRLLAILDGVSMNPYKTGAVGGVAIDALARPDANRLAIVGSGAQARGQLRAAVTVREFDEIVVYSPTKAHRESFARDLGEELGVTIEPVDSSAAAARGADVIVTATKADEPVVDFEHVEPGTHLNAIGVYDPDRRELDGETIAAATYVPDLRDRVGQDSGEYQLALAEGRIDEDHVHAELGEVVAGVAPGRRNESDITVFDSGGTAIETVAAAAMLYEKAAERDVGIELPMSSASEAFRAFGDEDDGED